MLCCAESRSSFRDAMFAACRKNEYRSSSLPLCRNFFACSCVSSEQGFDAWMLKCVQSSSISRFCTRLAAPSGPLRSLYEFAPCFSKRVSTTMVSPNSEGLKASRPPLARWIEIVAWSVPLLIRLLAVLVLRPVLDALLPKPAISAFRIADLPEPFLPTIKLTCGSKSTRRCVWFMKFSRTMARSTPFSYVCVSSLSAARALPLALARLMGACSTLRSRDCSAASWSSSMS
mmetsp:Transcript_44204/g.122517  ORF Transcript_44204/g.122517 Transcript_44204/m.122517 type:complete len:231 (+) Transcript_44204:2487-3179(+)